MRTALTIAAVYAATLAFWWLWFLVGYAIQARRAHKAGKPWN